MIKLFASMQASLSLVISLVGLPLATFAQSNVSPGKAAADARLRQRHTVFLDSVPLFAAGNHPAGEQLLLSVTPHQPGTAAWQHDAGLRLYSMAVYLRGQGYEVRARETVTRALNAFDVAATLARARGESVAAANAYQQSGLISDFFLGDVKTALAKLIEAQRLNPTGKNVGREVARLRLADDHLSRRTPGR